MNVTDSDRNSTESWFERKAREWNTGLTGQAAVTLPSAETYRSASAPVVAAPPPTLALVAAAAPPPAIAQVIEREKRSRGVSSDIMLVAENLAFSNTLKSRKVRVNPADLAKKGAQAVIQALGDCDQAVGSSKQGDTSEVRPEEQVKAMALAQAKADVLRDANAKVNGDRDLLVSVVNATKMANGDFSKGASDLTVGMAMTVTMTEEEKTKILDEMAESALVGKELVKMSRAVDMTSGMSLAAKLEPRERALILDAVAEAHAEAALEESLLQ
jgi:hypothetical protein